MGKIIKNNKVSIKKNCDMNDSDYLNDILISFKHLVNCYSIALCESSNKSIYKTFYNLFESSSKIQFELFECSFKNGWYQLETADENKIKKTFDKFNKCVNEFCIDNEYSD